MVWQVCQKNIAGGICFVNFFIASTPIGVDHSDKPPMRLDDFTPACFWSGTEQVACPRSGARPHSMASPLPWPASEQQAPGDDRQQQEPEKFHALTSAFS